MIWDNTDRGRLFVVDSNRSDYALLLEASAARHTEVVFFSTGRDALRAAPEEGPALWIVNMRLPDMAGIEFQMRLRSRGNHSPLALVGDRYSVEDEIAARTAGAEMYFEKSLVHEIVMATV